MKLEIEKENNKKKLIEKEIVIEKEKI